MTGADFLVHDRPPIRDERRPRSQWKYLPSRGWLSRGVGEIGFIAGCWSGLELKLIPLLNATSHLRPAGPWPGLHGYGFPTLVASLPLGGDHNFGLGS